MHRPAALACALALLLPSAAGAQSGGAEGELGDAPLLAQSGGDGNLGPMPPVGDDDDDDDGGGSGSGDGGSGDGDGSTGSGGGGPAATGELPDTGAEPGLVALLGAGLLVAGAGLRLRTADDRF